MDGLECSEVLLSYTRKSNDIFRIDSSFFAKKYLVHEKQLSLFPHTTVAKTGADVKSFGAYSLNNDVEYVSEGIPFLRCLNIKNGFIDEKNMLFITPGAHKLLWKSEVMPGSFLLTMSGTIGNAAIANSSLNYPINSNQDIAKIQFNGKYSNQVALAFFMSRYGSYQIEREARGSVQQHVFLSQVETLRLPCFRRDLVSAIDKCVNQAYSARIKSKQIYDDAMEMICDFFNVFGDSGKQSNQNETICIKTLKDSFAISGRLDSEYYQPKYDRLLDSLKKVPFRKLGGTNGIVSIKKSIEPGSDLYTDNGIPFVRVSDISPYELEDPAIRIPVDVVENANDLFPQKDTILFSKDGSVGIAYKVEKDMKLITSSALTIVLQVFALNRKDETFKTIEEMRRTRNSYEVIQQRPLNYFQYHTDIDWKPSRDLTATEENWFKELDSTLKQNSIIWFLDFVYRLRNALFHEIIDPLDQEWQIIFKNAYLVLKEIVDLNIEVIDSMPAKAEKEPAAPL